MSASSQALRWVVIMENGAVTPMLLARYAGVGGAAMSPLTRRAKPAAAARRVRPISKLTPSRGRSASRKRFGSLGRDSLESDLRLGDLS
jgi:hypothetical protein